VRDELLRARLQKERKIQIAHQPSLMTFLQPVAHRSRTPFHRTALLRAVRRTGSLAHGNAVGNV